MLSTFSTLIFRSKILDHLLRPSANFENLPVGPAKIVHLHSDRNFRTFWVNGNQPLLLHIGWVNYSEKRARIAVSIVLLKDIKSLLFPCPSRDAVSR